MSKKSKTKMILIMIILIAGSMLSILKLNTNYIKKNKINVDKYSIPIPINAIAYNRTDDGNIDTDVYEEVTAAYSIDNVDIKKSNGIITVTVDYSITISSYKNDTNDMSIFNFNYMDIYDAYTGKVLNLEDITSGNKTSNSMVVQKGVKYSIGATRKVEATRSKDYKDEDGNYYFSVKFTAHDVITMPHSYDGLLVGFNPVDRDSINHRMTKDDLDKEYFILDKMKDGSVVLDIMNK